MSPLISKLETLLGRDGDDMEKVENMLTQIEEYELLVKQLKARTNL